MVSTRARAARAASSDDLAPNAANPPTQQQSVNTDTGPKRASRRKAAAQREPAAASKPAASDTSATGAATNGAITNGAGAHIANLPDSGVANNNTTASNDGSDNTPTATGGRAPTRRLRSTKNAASPLRALPDNNTARKQPATRKRSVSKPASPTPTSSPTPESQSDTENDPGAGMYFKSNNRKLNSFITPSPPLKEVPPVKDAATQLPDDEGLVSDTSPWLLLRQEREEHDETRREVYRLRVRVIKLERQVQYEQNHNNELLAVNVRMGRKLGYTKPPPKQMSGDQLLMHVEAARDETTALTTGPLINGNRSERVESTKSPQASIGANTPTTSLVSVGTPAASTISQATSPTGTPAAAAQEPTTPKTGSFFVDFWSRLTTPFAFMGAPVVDTPTASSGSTVTPTAAQDSAHKNGSSTPSAVTPVSPHASYASPATPTPLRALASNSPATPPTAQQDTTFSDALTPTPTPVGERRPRTRKKRLTQAQKVRRAIVETVVGEVNSEEEKARAKAWARAVVKKLGNDPAILDKKRSYLEAGISVDDIDEYPSHKPWEQNAYGLVEGFDDEQAPSWYVLQQMLNEDLPDAKRRKTDSDGMDAEIQPLNGMPTSMLINTYGNSSSLLDLSPRPANSPSPMFGGPVVHTAQKNVFAGDKDVERKRVEFERELRIKGHIAGSGSFMVPEGSSDEEEEEEDLAEVENAAVTSAWTQPPPPPPQPAHASLPTPVAATPSVPKVQAVDDTSKVQTIDELERQRAKFTKHTPAVSSKLREVHFPSPSLRSDAGLESLVGSPAKYADLFSDMPDAESLGLSPEQEARVKARVIMSMANIPEWEDPYLVLSDDEEL